MSYSNQHPSGLTPDFRKLYLGTIQCLTDEQTAYRLKLRDVVLQGKYWSLVVYGPCGNGKTYLAKVAINTFNDGGFDGGIYTTQARIQAELWDDKQSNGDVFKRFASTRALVIDEISERPSDWTPFIKTTIENILIERHSRFLPTVLIGNLTKERLSEMFDTRVKDRLKEGLFKCMTGQSLRRRPTENGTGTDVQLS